jgi:hypothetical protein
MEAVNSSKTLESTTVRVDGGSVFLKHVETPWGITRCHNPDDMKNVLVMKSSLGILLSEFTIARHTSALSSCTEHECVLPSTSLHNPVKGQE